MNLYEIIEKFSERANKNRAVQMENYMRNQFKFFGLQAPTRKEIWTPYFKEAKKTKSIAWQFVEHCWLKEERECQYIATNYLLAMKKFLVVDDIEKLKNLAVRKSWWDTIDVLDRIIGSIVLNYPEAEQTMLEWSLDDNFWLRRIAIDHQLHRKEKTNVQLLEKIIVNNFGSDEFFINKAIGWSLRDYSKTNPQWVKNFIEKNKEKMANLSIREGSKYI